MTGVLSELKSFFVEQAARQPSPPVAKSIVLRADETDHSDETSEPPKSGIELAEGQSFIIDYRDGSGQVSRRSISVWAVRHGDDGVPLLVAKCHLRRATRTFRIDRIQTVMDYDGVVIEPIDEFLQDTLGIEWSHRPIIQARVNATTTKSKEPVREGWPLIRYTCRNAGAQLLCAVALADGELIPDETGEILDHLHRTCIARQIAISDDAAESLRVYVRRLRPTTETVEDAIVRLSSVSRSDLLSLLSACVRVMEADGVRHPEERQLIRMAALEFTGAEPAF